MDCGLVRLDPYYRCYGTFIRYYRFHLSLLRCQQPVFRGSYRYTPILPHHFQKGMSFTESSFAVEFEFDDKCCPGTNTLRIKGPKQITHHCNSLQLTDHDGVALAMADADADADSSVAFDNVGRLDLQSPQPKNVSNFAHDLVLRTAKIKGISRKATESESVPIPFRYRFKNNPSELDESAEFPT